LINSWSADKYNTKEAKCVFHTAALPVSPISSSNSLCIRPLGGSIPHHKERLCIQIFFTSLGIYPIPISLMFVFSCSDYIYTHEKVTESIYPWKTLQAFIILSCIISVSVNFSTFMVIGKTSPVTYQVLGHLKTCLVLGFGYTLLHDPFTMRNIIGILVAIFGMGLYSYFCVQENKKKQSVDLSLASQVLYIYIYTLLIFWHEYLCSLFRNWKQIATPCLFQMKDKDSTPILGMQDKEISHDAKKSTKDSLV